MFMPPLSPAAKCSVLLIDDDVELARMLSAYLALDNYAVMLAHDGRSAGVLLRQREFDVTLLDLMLPDLNGLELLRHYRLHSRKPVIMLSAHGNEADRVLGLESGADDFLCKPFGPRELKARIQAVMRRAGEPAEAGAEILTLGPLSLSPTTGEAWWEGRPLVLTGSEQRVLKVLMRAPGQLVSRPDIARHALGRALQLHDRSVETHISNLRRKLALERSDAPLALRNLRGQGYVLTLRDAGH